ncbi:MAG: DUF3352 domain-containing protein [Actinomycetota bacterium]
MKRVFAMLLAVTMLAAGCGRKDEAGSGAASLVPANALAFVSVSLDPANDQKRNLQGVLAKFPELDSEEEFSGQVDALLTGLFEGSGLAYAEDIKAWLGKEVAFVVLPPKDQGEGAEPLLALLIETTDTEAAQAALDKGAREGEFESGDYKIVGNHVVFLGQDRTADRAAALAAIESQAAGDKAPLAETDAFRNVVDKVHSPRLALGWWNAEATFGLLGESFAIPGFDQIIEDAEGQGGGGNFAFALYAEPDQLALEGVTDATGKASEFSGVPRLTRGLPADTLGAITAFGVGSQVSEGLRGVAETDADVAQEIKGFLDQMKLATGLDLEQDVLSWMNGEAVIAAGKVGPLGIPDIGILVEPTDRAKAEAGFLKIKDAAERTLGVPLATGDLEGTTSYAIPEAIEEGLQPAMGLLADRFILASSPEYLKTLARSASPGFGGTSEYREIAGSGDEPVSAQVVVRLAAVREAIVAALPPDAKATYEAEVRPWVEPLRTLLMRAFPDDGGKFEMRITTD